MAGERHFPRDRDALAGHMADRFCQGLVHRDRGERAAAAAAFAAVDRLQFAHVSDHEARRATEGYVDALWVIHGASRRAEGGVAERSAMEDALERRADAAGIDPDYAALTAEAWHRRATGGDYWTPMMNAQMLELRAALQDPTYPDKLRHGQSGFGAEPARYLQGVELHHDGRRAEAREVMTHYFRRILDARSDGAVADAAASLRRVE